MKMVNEDYLAGTTALKMEDIYRFLCFFALCSEFYIVGYLVSIWFPLSYWLWRLIVGMRVRFHLHCFAEVGSDNSVHFRSDQRF